MLLACVRIFIIIGCFAEAEDDEGYKSPPCGLLHSNELYNNPNLTLVSEFPWVVSIKYASTVNYSAGIEEPPPPPPPPPESDHHFYCSGTLINARYVLTSASCVVVDRLNLNVSSVRVGKYNVGNTGVECVKNLLSNDCTASTVDIDVESTIIFPTYDAASLENNIALMKLAQNATFTDYVRPICLQDSSSMINPDFTKEYWTSGYLSVDTTKIIKAGNREAISDPECSGKLSHYLDRAYNLTKNTFCTRDGLKGSSCIVDAGSPLTFPSGEQWYQEGIASFNTNCTLNAITTYTRLSNYIDWIKENSDEM